MSGRDVVFRLSRLRIALQFFGGTILPGVLPWVLPGSTALRIVGPAMAVANLIASVEFASLRVIVSDGRLRRRSMCFDKQLDLSLDATTVVRRRLRRGSELLVVRTAPKAKGVVVPIKLFSTADQVALPKAIRDARR